MNESTVGVKEFSLTPTVVCRRKMMIQWVCTVHQREDLKISDRKTDRKRRFENDFSVQHRTTKLPCRPFFVPQQQCLAQKELQKKSTCIPENHLLSNQHNRVSKTMGLFQSKLDLGSDDEWKPDEGSLSHVGKAVYQELHMKHSNFRHKMWNATLSAMVGPLQQTPSVKTFTDNLELTKEHHIPTGL
jgi:hypothetical protein